MIKSPFERDHVRQFEIIASFGAAQLVKKLDGSLQFQGYNQARDDRNPHSRSDSILDRLRTGQRTDSRRHHVDCRSDWIDRQSRLGRIGGGGGFGGGGYRLAMARGGISRARRMATRQAHRRWSRQGIHIFTILPVRWMPIRPRPWNIRRSWFLPLQNHRLTANLS